MNPQSEIELWRSAWKAGDSSREAPAFDATAAHQRQERRVRLHFVANLLWAVSIFALTVWVLETNWSSESLAWAAVVWLSTAGSTAVYVRNWRALWRNHVKSVGDYVSICEMRCTATLRAVRFGYGFLALQVMIAAPWLTIDFARGEAGGGRYALGMFLLAAIVAAFLVSFRRARRKALLELAQIEDFQRSSEEPGTVCI